MDHSTELGIWQNYTDIHNSGYINEHVMFQSWSAKPLPQLLSKRRNRVSSTNKKSPNYSGTFEPFFETINELSNSRVEFHCP
jgi:hypothetical protein